MRTVTDPMLTAVRDALNSTYDAELYAYAGGGDRLLKNDLIAAHSALLRARNRIEAAHRKRIVAVAA